MVMTPSLSILAHRFKADERAVSAVEFALILPILILLLLASFDITRAIDAKTKTGLLAHTIVNFVSQENDGVNQTALANIIKASKFILHPYSDAADVLTINIESVVRVSESPLKYEIDWSYPPANKTNRPTTEMPAGESSAIRADVTYVYKLKFLGYLTKRLGFSEITLNSTESMQPRLREKILATW